jgi:hypothetical protein
MPDDTSRFPHAGGATGGAPRDWNAAFAALPLERPEADAWPDIARRLPSRRMSRWPAKLAIAAALALAIVVPLRLLAPATAPPGDIAAPAPQVASQTAPLDPLEQLYAESAQLEGLLAIARDDTVSSGAAAEVSADLDGQLARIDAQLRQPGLARDRQLALWRARVDALRSSVTFESTRRWLAVHGQGYDGALVRVD